jgi:preprotein translocase subunit YajC
MDLLNQFNGISFLAIMALSYFAVLKSSQRSEQMTKAMMKKRCR